jgi:S-adenosylmethionine uptake transporter
LSQDRTALLLALAGIFLLTVMDSIAKGLAAHYSAFETMRHRHVAGLFFTLFIFLWFRPGWPDPAQWRTHAGRTLIMMTTGLMFFHALGRMPLAELFVYTFTSPMFVALFGALILKERLTGATALGLALGFSGILAIVLTDPGARFGGGSLDGLAAALLSPVTYALAMVLLRKQAGSEPVARIVFIQSLITASLLVLLVTPFAPLPRQEDLPEIAAMGLLGAAGGFLLAMGFARADAAKVSVAEYTGLIWAAIIGYAFFAETPRAMVWVGAALVVAGCLAVARARPGSA